MKTILHAAAGALSLLLVTSFLASTIVAELFLTYSAVASVKAVIAATIALLVLSMVATGASGAFLARGRISPIIAAKMRRMKLIAANGLIVMLPSAIFLYLRSADNHFDAIFLTVQAIEIAGGIVQLGLLGANFRDGLRMTRTRRSAARRSTSP
ncbi:hypothetical protein JJB09_06760 [Rhizobium sp. KVB221]|uniref:Transmembrane protein n=1 Tax=Rhizobium setariae TaxID=2801340 RepID=A0A937CN77_9HYPH|nr:hypothetical protein [Rhizobium setariae]MBL0371724.1 hypothetical protein [Rhizobium setariae]